MNNFFSYGSASEPEPAPEPVPEPDTQAGADSGHQPAPRAILGDLGSDDWEVLIGYAARRRYPPGAVIVAAGSTDPALCFIASGKVAIRGAGPAGSQGVRGEGEVFGMLSFLDAAPSAVTATVAPGAPAELLLLSPDALQQLAAWQPRIATALLRDLGAHVAARLRRLQTDD